MEQKKEEEKVCKKEVVEGETDRNILKWDTNLSTSKNLVRTAAAHWCLSAMLTLMNLLTAYVTILKEIYYVLNTEYIQQAQKGLQQAPYATL